MTESTVPGLATVIQRGYNTIRGDFAGEPVFQLTYAHGVSQSYGPDGAHQTYPVPDGVSVTTDNGTANLESSSLLETTSDYDAAFSASVSGSMTYTSYSGSASSSIAYRGSLFQKTSTYYAASFGMQKVYSTRRNDVGSLDPAFAAALTALPLHCTTEDEQAAYFHFFDVYGTHYLESGALGCYFAMQTEIDSEFVEESSYTEVTAAVSAAYDGVTSSGKLSVEASASENTTLSSNSSSFSFSFYTFGGDGSLAYAEDGGTQAFFASAYENPILLLDLAHGTPVVMQPLSNAIPAGDEHDARVTAFTNALTDYIDAALAADGLFGSPEEVVLIPNTANDTASATSTEDTKDGFFIGMVSRNDQDSDNDRGSLSFCANPPDTSTTATVLRATASMHYYTKKNIHIWQTSLMCPVRKDDLWLAQFAAKSKSPTPSLTFQPLNFAKGTQFGAWTSLPIGSVFTPPTSGLVVAWITCSSDGARGSIQGYQPLPSAGGAVLPVATASAHKNPNTDEWVTTNSFCMPVPAGVQCQVVSVPTSGTPQTSAYFLPIEGDDTLVRAPMADSQVAKCQPHDGILVVSIWTASDGARGNVKVYLTDSVEDLADYDELDPTAVTSIHYDSDDDRQITYNSVAVPIPKGMFYQPVLTTTSGTIGARMTWFPMVAKTPE